ncbi:hypothetical protein FSHL1_006616 [Fusarium sambucinum]
MVRHGIARVKTGCGTCRMRRVKCDEQRPFCRRCLSGHRECKGYGIWDNGRHPDGPISQSVGLACLNNSGAMCSLSTEDFRIFEWFMLSRPQGVFPLSFWEKLVPQACHDEPAILHSVLAMGSVHRRLCISKASGRDDGEADKLALATLQYYNMAINSLYKLQADGSQLGKSRGPAQVTLIACLLFVVVEYLQKRPAQGLLHLRHGLQIMRSHGFDSKSQATRSPVDDELIEAFGRLNTQAQIFSSFTTNTQPPLKSCQQHYYNVPLKSVTDARQRLDLLVSDACHLRHWGRIAESSTDISLSFQNLLLQQKLQRHLSLWLKTYRAWQAMQLLPSFNEQVAQHLLFIYYTMASIITATALYYGDESVFDHYKLQFASITTRSRDILQMFQPMRSNDATLEKTCTPHFTFTSDLGLVPALYFTVLKCRDSQVRRDALSILATETRQEGAWEGSRLALIAAEVVRLEKGPHLEYSEIPSGADVCERMVSNVPFPQSGRICDVVFELPSGSEGELILTCKRRSAEGNWIITSRRYNGAHWY